MSCGKSARGCRQEQGRQTLDQRRLARAVRTEKPKDLAGKNIEVNVLERDDFLDA